MIINSFPNIFEPSYFRGIIGYIVIIEWSCKLIGCSLYLKTLFMLNFSQMYSTLLKYVRVDLKYDDKNVIFKVNSNINWTSTINYVSTYWLVQARIIIGRIKMSRAQPGRSLLVSHYYWFLWFYIGFVLCAVTKNRVCLSLYTLLIIIIIIIFICFAI